MRSAVILAGGPQSGSDADRLPAADIEPLVRRVSDRIGPAVEEIVVNCRQDQRAALGEALADADVRFALDPTPDGGPVAAIRTGCRVARGRWTFVTSCPTPFVDAEAVEALFDRVEADAGTRPDGAVPRLDGWLRPLASVYHTDTLVDACDTTLDLGTSSPQELLARLSTVTVNDAGPARAADSGDLQAHSRSVESR
jgi:molybdopterin-guanine dinucleotide biosynthesis protein A